LVNFRVFFTKLVRSRRSAKFFPGSWFIFVSPSRRSESRNIGRLQLSLFGHDLLRRTNGGHKQRYTQGQQSTEVQRIG
jgi:hypothetical protein